MSWGEVLAILTGAVAVALAGFIVGLATPPDVEREMRTKCEARLPRDQHCVMQFVPAPAKKGGSV